MEKPARLCASCGAISLARLVEAVPIPARPGPGRGVPNFFEFSIPQPLSFPHVDAARPSCALCSLVFARAKTATGAGAASAVGPLELAALCPPSRNTHDGLELSTPTTPNLNSFGIFGEAQPQWRGCMEGEKRVNTLEPITKHAGTRHKTAGYRVDSPWQINVAAEEGSAASSHITRRPLNKRGSSESYQGILRAMEECNSSHAKCRLGVDGLPINGPPGLPTRVIDVGSADQSPRLILSDGRRANYATLSHCWGSQRWVATTTGSLQHMLTGFDLVAMPKTYTDAILVARNLRIQYLWIDSFCIVQDDRDDWEAESQKMGYIYENAYINIAAAGALDGSIGFLGSRKQDPVYVRVPAEGQEGDHFYFTDQPNSDFDAYVSHAELNTRGWVLQERLLSRRTIHFAADMWYWECGHHVVSEDGWQHDTRSASSVYRTPLRETLKGSVMEVGKVFRHDDVKEEKQQPQTGSGSTVITTTQTEVLWAQILRAYSKCDLTFPSDKLPALQGLVNRFKTVAQSPYVFGHWLQPRESLPLSLMWFAATDGGLAFPTELNNLAVPSWSCLKGNGPVEFHDTRDATPCTMIDAVGGGGGGGPGTGGAGAGALLPSTILLRGRIRKANPTHPNGETPPSKPTFYALSFKSETPYGTFTRTLGPARFDDAAEVPEEVTLLLAWQAVTSGSKNMNAQMDQLALVLREVDGTGPEDGDGVEDGGGVARYKRIGIANVNNHSFYDGVPFSSLVIV